LELSSSNSGLRRENYKFEQMLRDAEERVATEEARAVATQTVAVQGNSRASTLEEFIAGQLNQQQQHRGQTQTIASATAASLEQGMPARFGQLQQEQEDQTVPLDYMGGLESVLAGLLSQLQQPKLDVQSYQGFQRDNIEEARALVTHNVSVQRDELLAGHILQQQQQQQQQQLTWQNQTMASSREASLEAMLARFGQSQQERVDQTAPISNRVGLESVFTGLLPRLQQPFQEHGSTRLGTGSPHPKGRVISQIPLDHSQEQQSQASILILLASLDPSTLQSLMTGAPGVAAQPANTALHRQEPSLDLCQLMSLGFTLEQALECYRSLPP
jgi:hypothetical protein